MLRLHKAFVALLLAGSLATWAQDDDLGMEELSLDELLNLVVTTGSFLDLDMNKSPLSMTLIKKMQITVSGARNLTELLEIYVPGFQYSYNAWNGVQWSMRGVSNDRNTKFLVLINGHKINSESKDGFIAETELGLLGDIERIEVLRGPAGLVYGSGAIAGIVNIVTRTDATNKTELSVTLGTAGPNLGQTSKTYDMRSSYLPADGHRLAATLGWKESQGMGEGATRQYANNVWPYCSWCGDDRDFDGTPSDGSYGKTPGNWRASLDYQWKELRLYGRMTHQEMTNAYFIYDPWPNHNMGWDSTLPSVMIDGQSIAFDDPFWAQVESWGNQRNNYVNDNITVDAYWETPIGAENKLKLEAAFDGATNRSVKDLRQGYTDALATERAGTEINSTFGERRYTMGATALWKDIVPLTQLATGIQQRFDDIGPDLAGKNFSSADPDHPAIADVLYSNTALFTEGMTDFLPNLALGYGLRWDGHTRTIDDGGTANGKLALVYAPVPNHTIKLIAQTSTNNGTADNYEYNASFYNNDGDFVSGNPAFLNPAVPTAGIDSATLKNRLYVVYLTDDDLHELKPERVVSYELTSTHNFDNTFYLSPSVSYNTVSDLYAWAQPLGRGINAGEYHHLDVDFEARMETRYVDMGFNHSIQLPVNTSIQDLGDSITVGIIDTTQDGWYEAYGVNASGDSLYRPVANDSTTIFVNPAEALLIQTTDDEGLFNKRTFFRGMHTSVSKAYIDIKPVSWIVLHSDLRLFWGLVGRTDQYNNLETCGDASGCATLTNLTRDTYFQTWQAEKEFMAKWNASIHVLLPENLNVSIFVYNILGSDNPYSTNDDDWTIHSLRWGNGADNTLHAVDLRSYAMRVEKSF